jgi:multisubunit Na+/H+ antiporter MnhF subunit
METVASLLFVGLVTCYLLVRVFTGPASPAEVVVYGMTAAFGLEYLMSSWRGLWRSG